MVEVEVRRRGRREVVAVGRVLRVVAPGIVGVNVSIES